MFRRCEDAKLRKAYSREKVTAVLCPSTHEETDYLKLMVRPRRISHMSNINLVCAADSGRCSTLNMACIKQQLDSQHVHNKPAQQRMGSTQEAAMTKGPHT